MALPPPPIRADLNARVWKDWFVKVQTEVVGPTATVNWVALNFAGSSLVDILTRPHSALQSILGTGDLHISSTEAAGVWSGPLKSTSPTGGVGYATGAGGTVTQLTNKTTAVTLNTAAGQITMKNTALAAGTIVSFTLTNSAIEATDVLVLNHVSTGTLGAYSLNAACALGSATISVRNNTAGSLSEAIVLQFALIKAVTS